MRPVGWFIAFLLFASTVTRVLNHLGIHPNGNGLFDLDREQNIPTLFSSLGLFTAAVLLACIARIHRREQNPFTRYWAVLAVIFLALTIDEFCSIHETMAIPVRRLFGDEHAGFILGETQLGIFNFSWVIPALAGLAGLGAWYLRFLAHLPKSTRREFIVAGLIYVGGAVGMEMIGGRHSEVHGQQNLVYGIYTTIEDGMEMIGILLFIRALLRYIAASYGSLSLEFQPRSERPAESKDAAAAGS